jgi:uncharacterized damage-inducible protein DinB
MNELLHDPIRHNSWATKHLLSFCRDSNLTAEQLSTPGVGTYGSILATLNHLIRSDAGYLENLIGRAPAWTDAHREQVCAILTGLDVEPPDVQPWEYAWTTGRLWQRQTSS